MIPPRTFFIQDDNKWANVCYIFGQNNRKQSLWIKVKQSEKNVKIQDKHRTNVNLECAFFHAMLTILSQSFSKKIFQGTLGSGSGTCSFF